MNKELTKIGMVHGRFQAFHLEHLSYIKSGIEKCDHLIIGITNPEPEEFIHEESSSHRHLLQANPFTFYERATVIHESLDELKFSKCSYTIVPFHLFHNHKWQYYLPKSNLVNQFVRVFSEWELKKIKTFNDYGFNVTQIDEGKKKTISGSLVRNLVRKDGDWRSIVPNATKRMMQEYGIERIKNSGLE